MKSRELLRDVKLALTILATAYASITLSVAKAIVDRVTGASHFYATLDELSRQR